jgi:hypothetical protein
MKSRKQRWTTIIEDRAEQALMKIAAGLIFLGLAGITATILWHMVIGVTVANKLITGE